MGIKEELTLIQGKRKMVRVADIHDWASEHRDSSWGRRLEWNDKKAGKAYRFWQIRQLLSITVDYDDQEASYISLSVDRVKAGGGYRRLSDVVNNKSLHEIMMSDALEELERMKEKYDSLAELKPVWVAAHRIKTKVKVKSPKQKEERPEA